MVLKKLSYELTVCKVKSPQDFDCSGSFYFMARTDEEYSLVCPTEEVPAATLEREDGWKAFRIEGVLDFSLIGILSKISAILAQENIGIFAVSTFNTDYILVKKEQFASALQALEEAGYSIEE